jgi:hypothetical protein
VVTVRPNQFGHPVRLEPVQRTKEIKTAPAGNFEALVTDCGHPYRRVRLLQRLGTNRGVRDIKTVALETYALLGPSLDNYFKSFVKDLARTALV